MKDRGQRARGLFCSVRKTHGENGFEFPEKVRCVLTNFDNTPIIKTLLHSIVAYHRDDMPEGEEPMELNRAVAENIKRIRKTKKLSMERLAQEAGVSRSMLGQIERGEANPSVALLGKLAAALKVPAEVLLENDDFQSLLLARELDTKPIRLDAGKTVLRPSFPYDEVTRQESFFLDLYISAQYAPEPSVPGCLCHATVLSGTVALEAEEQSFQLLERDALRFAADRPYRFSNMTSANARLLLVYRYMK